MEYITTHHAMARKDRVMSKVRVVYDTSCNSESASPSLNQCLHVGPSFGQSILDSDQMQDLQGSLS